MGSKLSTRIERQHSSKTLHVRSHRRGESSGAQRACCCCCTRWPHPNNKKPASVTRAYTLQLKWRLASHTPPRRPVGIGRSSENDRRQRRRGRESVFKRFSHSLMLFITSQQLQRGVAACNCVHRSFGPETTNQDGFLFPLRRLTVSESSDLEMGHYLTWTRSDVKEH